MRVSIDLPVAPSTWIALPDLAERLEVPVTKVHQMIREGTVLAVRQDGVLRVPAELVANHTVSKHLPGVLTLLRDAGYNDEEALRWLYTPDDTLALTVFDANFALRLKKAQMLGTYKKAVELDYGTFEVEVVDGDITIGNEDAFAVWDQSSRDHFDPTADPGQRYIFCYVRVIVGIRTSVNFNRVAALSRGDRSRDCFVFFIRSYSEDRHQFSLSIV